MRVEREWRALGTLRVRLTLWYVALLALILVAFSAFLYVSLERTLHAEIDRSLEAQARRFVAPLQVLSTRPPRETSGNLSRPRPPVAGTVMALYDPSGETLVFGDTWEERDLADARAVAVGGARDLRTVVDDDGEPWRVLTLPVDREGQRLAVAQVARSEGDIGSALA
nr:hypothetical protein [Chloroflexota bacterium]